MFHHIFRVALATKNKLDFYSTLLGESLVIYFRINVNEGYAEMFRHISYRSFFIWIYWAGQT